MQKKPKKLDIIQNNQTYYHTQNVLFSHYLAIQLEIQLYEVAASPLSADLI
jgi:hypothetical protein